ncbi:MAG: 4Fe-4S binding protein [Chloroflexi bacterium]|nr:4Fe-4S binding protein [Chloroflexota bacterium]
MSTIKKAIPEIDQEKCTGCGECIEKCPAGVVRVVNGKAVVTEACMYCTDCESICPSGAIECPFDIILVQPPSETGNKKTES